jgi:hypothetical protein
MPRGCRGRTCQSSGQARVNDFRVPKPPQQLGVEEGAAAGLRAQAIPAQGEGWAREQRAETWARAVRGEESSGAQGVCEERPHVQLGQAGQHGQQVHRYIHRESRGQTPKEKGGKVVQALRTRVAHAAHGPGGQQRAAEAEVVEDGATVRRVPEEQHV